MSKPINGVTPAEWAKHLRPWGKRLFWKRLRASPTIQEGEYEPTEPQKKPKIVSPAKRFGFSTTYTPTWLGLSSKPFTVDTWYKTEKARDQAYQNMIMKDKHNPVQYRHVLEKVER